MVTLRVFQTWKGSLPAQVTFPTGMDWTDDTRTLLRGSSCLFGFGLGRRYLVFTYGESLETMWPAESCGPSMAYEAAAEQIALLDEIYKENRAGR